MTQDIVVIVIKAVAGGSFVLVFALLGEVLRPKWFAGLFSAAPSIAIASLIVTAVEMGDHQALLAAIGMMFGVAGFVTFTLLVRPLLDRLGAIRASGVAAMVWAAVAIGGYLVVLG
jgi:uncharacterized membrane protein (GlpM family)